MNSYTAPCRDCTDRQPGCHNPSTCERWAVYAAACQTLRDRRREYARTWSFESGRDRNKTLMLKARQRRAASKNR